MERTEGYTDKELWDWIYLELELIKKDLQILETRTKKEKEEQ